MGVQYHAVRFQTKNMSKLKELIKSSKTKKILYLIVVVLVVILVYLISKSLPTNIQKQTNTVPVIPTPTSYGKPEIPLDTVNPFNPSQKLVFNWGNLSPDLPTSLNNYSIKAPIVTVTTINSISSKLGFTLSEKSPYTDSESLLWVNNNRSLFGSPKQNQISFNTTGSTPKHTTTISKDDAIGIAKGVISNLLGEEIMETFTKTPEVTYHSFDAKKEDEPKTATPETANTISISFQQEIDSLPFLNLSSNGETFSVVIDTDKKIYLFYIHGGYQSLSSNGQVNIVSFADLVNSAPTSAIRISSSEDIASERAFTESNIIRINVIEVLPGYFQRADNTIFPVFIIKGDMSASGLNPYPATYIVPATK